MGVKAQVLSSDAKKNSPFRLELSGTMALSANIKCNGFCVMQSEEDKTFNTPFYRVGEGTIACNVDVPKSKVGACEIMNYSMNVKTQNMPIVSVFNGGLCYDVLFSQLDFDV